MNLRRMKQQAKAIEMKLTTALLALSLFRSNYYNDVKFPIHIPNQNEDTFIRRGYYGGHTDVYIPKGENLYYYDINSLYPFVMKKYPMPGGVPVWHSDLTNMELDSMCGFIQAFVVCPKTIKRPFLPYRNKEGTLIFPTGQFIGVYYSEELKFARTMGYRVIPICGYLFQEMESPFKEYINSLFESRSNAKKEGNNAIAYVYKLLLNSLYGRFGINPISTITEMCNQSRRDFLLRDKTFINESCLREDLYMVSYYSNVVEGKGAGYWKPPKNSAVQLSAAITACARIEMYPYISRDDCYYTDTDSIVLGNPLPESDISSSSLGKFKLEDKIVKGFFLAPKSYFYTTVDGNQVLKFKGPANSYITREWFEQQYNDPSRVTKFMIPMNFRVDWKNVQVGREEVPQTIRILDEDKNKRIPIFNKENKWVGTVPKYISELEGIDHLPKTIIRYLLKIDYHDNENGVLNGTYSKTEAARINAPCSTPVLTKNPGVDYTQVQSPDISYNSDQPENPEKPDKPDPPEIPDEKPNKPDPPEK